MATLTEILEPLAEMTATLNVVVSINSTTVMQTYWTASLDTRHPGSPLTRCFYR